MKKSFLTLSEEVIPPRDIRTQRRIRRSREKDLERCFNGAKWRVNLWQLKAMLQRIIVINAPPQSRDTSSESNPKKIRFISSKRFSEEQRKGVRSLRWTYAMKIHYPLLGVDFKYPWTYLCGEHQKKSDSEDSKQFKPMKFV